MRFPQEAFYANVDRGTVDIRCDVRPDRMLENCDVVAERPRGYRFGRAAIASLADARITQEAVDRLEDGEVRFTMRFRR